MYENETQLLLKSDLRPGNFYCSREAADFLRPVFQKHFKKYGHSLERILRGDSGFASPEIYDVCEETEIKYLIRLKINKKLIALTEELKVQICHEENIHQEEIIQVEFFYQAGSWKHPRCVVVEAKRKSGQMCCDYTFVVTNLKTRMVNLVFELYRKRGSMENYIKEAKNGFRMDKVIHHDLVANKNMMQIRVLSYNLVHLFSLNILPFQFRQYQIEILRNIKSHQTFIDKSQLISLYFFDI